MDGWMDLSQSTVPGLLLLFFLPHHEVDLPCATAVQQLDCLRFLNSQNHWNPFFCSHQCIWLKWKSCHCNLFLYCDKNCLWLSFHFLKMWQKKSTKTRYFWLKRGQFGLPCSDRTATTLMDSDQSLLNHSHPLSPFFWTNQTHFYHIYFDLHIPAVHTQQPRWVILYVETYAKSVRDFFLVYLSLLVRPQRRHSSVRRTAFQTQSRGGLRWGAGVSHRGFVRDRIMSLTADVTVNAVEKNTSFRSRCE